MAKPRAVLRDAAEADRLLKELTAKPGEVPTGEPPAQPAPTAAEPPAQPAPTAAEPPAQPAPTAAEPPAQPAPTAADDDFRQKYSVLRGKYDKEIPELKAQVSELFDNNRQLQRLLEQAAERKTPPPSAAEKHLIKPEERAEYGEDFFDVVGRRAREVYETEINSLKERIDQMSGQRARVDTETARQKVFTALDEQVPNWQAINGDKNFLAWLADPDVFSGRTKRELLSEAFESHNAARVVGFFKAFQEDSPGPAPAARHPTVDAGTLVAPGAARSGAPVDAPGGGRMWHESEISQFYADVRRGKISPEDRKRIEAEIFKAAAEGRVR